MNDNLEKLNKTCSKMDNHIDFVENTYDSLKFPLNYIKNRVEYFAGTSDNKKLLS